MSSGRRRLAIGFWEGGLAVAPEGCRICRLQDARFPWFFIERVKVSTPEQIASFPEQECINDGEEKCLEHGFVLEAQEARPWAGVVAA
jgi:hypothetical protein